MSPSRASGSCRATVLALLALLPGAALPAEPYGAVKELMTARHHHGTPIFIYILEGDVSVDYEGRGKRTYRAGDAFMEGMEFPHAATNVGKSDVRILAVFLESAT